MSANRTGLYIHVPFCSIKCFYCDFVAVSGQGGWTSRYLDCLGRELRLFPERKPTTVYVGGGTPSELSAEEISLLFGRVGDAYAYEKEEITFEANPESLTPAKIEALKRAGVTRLSLGLQTLDDRLLQGIGRRHTADDFVRVFRSARAAGFAINADLMYNLPGQTLESCLDSLNGLIALDPQHISLYGLQVEDRTLFGKRGLEPDEDLGREMFERCLDILSRAGYIHYEISNFARPGHESIHNMIYWNNGEYVGLGCGAASYLDGCRSTNVERLKDYCEAVEAGRRPVASAERLDGKAALGEELMLRLRLVAGFKPAPRLERAFTAQLAALERRGLVERVGGRLRLTREGIFLANEAFREFVAPFAEEVGAA